MNTKELNELLGRYERDELDKDERIRLGELLRSEEGRIAALGSQAPEALFLADEQMEEPEWDQYWNAFNQRIGEQVNRDEQPTSDTPRYLAAAAATVLMIGLVAIFSLFQNPGTEPVAEQSISYRLEHRSPQWITSQLGIILGKETQISIDPETSTITLTDNPGRLAQAENTLRLLDSKPLELVFNLELLEVLDPDGLQVQQVDGLPSEEIDRDKVRTLDSLVLRVTEGVLFNEVIDGRYRVSVTSRFQENPAEFRIEKLTVFDQETGRMIINAQNITVSGSWSRALSNMSTAHSTEVLGLLTMAPAEADIEE